MFYHLFYPLRDLFFGFNVFRYVTFRAAMAAITAFLFSVIVGPWLIRTLQGWNMRNAHDRAGFEKIAEKTQHKAKIPTMGGLLIVGAICAGSLLWGDLQNKYLWLALVATVWMGAIGFADDYLKMAFNNSKGLQAITKLAGQLILGLSVGYFLYSQYGWDKVHVPMVKDFAIVLGPVFVLFVCAVIVGASNAVNLTDGLDGLAIGCSIFIAIAYAILSYLTGHAVFSEYLNLPFLAGSWELTVFCAAIAGAGLGFLWFNAHPASVFMGDTGSLALGGAFGITAILIKKELLLIIIGGVFVVEALSVILQVFSFKVFKRRIFKMSPIHHHFQLEGWAESKIVIRFWIVSVILALAGIASIKLM